MSPQENRTWLQIDSLEALMSHEEEIVARIAEIRNGGNLFLANPFMLLADMGVELSDQAKEEILEIEPSLSTVSKTPYESLKSSRCTQNLQIEVKGLFRRRRQ